jgi:ribose 5-phosphate isomerase A
MNEAAKQAAGRAAAALVQDGMRLGLGSGSTMRHAIIELGRRVREEKLDIAGVPTSGRTAALAGEHGIRLVELDATPLDLALDGADEIEAGTLRLVKGFGGALRREKIVAQAARRFVVVADESKLVPVLGQRGRLPVEIDRFGQHATAHRIAELGGAPVLRLADGKTFITDGGNIVLDCAGFSPLRDPFTLERQLHAIAGVVETGLFLLPVEQALLGAEDGGVRVLVP